MIFGTNPNMYVLMVLHFLMLSGTGGSGSHNENKHDEIRSRFKRALPNQGFSSAEQAQIVSYHNQLRTQVNPAAKSMKTIVWEPLLATKAQIWTNACDYKHSQASSQTVPLGGPMGENIALGNEAQSTPTGVIDRWWDEYKIYDYCKGDWMDGCTTGPFNCGHYTAIAWSNTDKIGCGRTKCPNHSGLYFITCNYFPSGNYRNVQPYELLDPNACSGSTTEVRPVASTVTTTQQANTAITHTSATNHVATTRQSTSASTTTSAGPGPGGSGSSTDSSSGSQCKTGQAPCQTHGYDPYGVPCCNGFFCDTFIITSYGIHSGNCTQNYN